jgi:genome maintenance exonuclease 1
LLVKNSVSNRKEFSWFPDEFDYFPREEINGIRHYVTPNGSYPSVTTVLGAMLDKSALIEWRKRVGDEEADRVSRLAATRGTNIHNMCESYVRGEDVDVSMPFNLVMFNQIKKVLDEHVNDIVGCELTLASDELKVAGSCDLIALYDGKLSIIDYKTSTKNKMKGWIESYFLQTVLYSYMLWEMTGMMAKQCVIIIAVEEEAEAQVFIVKPREYLEKAAELCRQYHKEQA